MSFPTLLKVIAWFYEADPTQIEPILNHMESYLRLPEAERQPQARIFFPITPTPPQSKMPYTPETYIRYQLMSLLGPNSESHAGTLVQGKIRDMAIEDVDQGQAGTVGEISFRYFRALYPSHNEMFRV